MSAREQLLIELDAELVKLGKPLSILKHLNWPDEIGRRFIASWRARAPALPAVELHAPDWSGEIAAIYDFVSDAPANTPCFNS
jgi:hypothetical protein